MGGKVKEFTTKPGDTVLYSKFGLGATELEVGGREFILIREVSSLEWDQTGSVALSMRHTAVHCQAMVTTWSMTLLVAENAGTAMRTRCCSGQPSAHLCNLA